MIPIRKAAFVMALPIMAAALLVSGGVRADSRHHQDDPYAQLKSYDFQNRTAVQAIYKLIQAAQDDKAQAAQIEQHLIPILKDPDATFAGKQEACRMLWIVGSDASVPALAAMLEDEKLANVARYALERNTSPVAAKALRSALAKATGTTQIGIINSIGDRGDAEATADLKPLAASSNAPVSEAATTALGKIGTDRAMAVLRTLPASSLVVNKAMVRCADKMAASGNKTEAEKIYLGLSGENRPVLIRAEAVRGLAAIDAPHSSAVTLAALKSTDPYLQDVAAHLAGASNDAYVRAHSIVEYPGLPVPAQVVLLTALGDRHEAAAAALALGAIKSADPALRVAGIHAASRIGSPNAVPVLIDTALHGDGQDRGEARDALAAMHGQPAAQAILDAAQQGPADARSMLMGVLADRPSAAATAALLAGAQGSDAHVAVAAVRSLAKTGGAMQSADLLKLLLTTQNDDVRDASREAVVTLGQRQGDQDSQRDVAAAPLIGALPAASAVVKASLLSALAQIGGDQALEALSQATSADDAAVKQAAVSGLADTWSDIRPLPILLSIAKSDTNRQIRIQALRGYLRLEALNEKASDEARANQLEQALAVAERPEEKKQILAILRDSRVPHSMALAAKMLDDPTLFSEAADTVIYLAGARKKGDRNQAAVTGDATNAALDKVIQMTADDKQKSQAQALRQ